MLGGNGAGKTTFLRILATLTRPDAGSVVLNGFDAAVASEEVRRTTGVVMHSPMLYGDLTVRENLLFYARMFRIARGGSRIEETARLLEIEGRLDDRVRSLSHGLQKRAGLARALLHRPQLLLLDEPESGLDQTATALLERVVGEHRASGGASIVTTHSLERAVRLCDRLVILGGGRIVYDSPGSALDVDSLREIYSRHLERA
jgi:ABC-type multidrug transport system ATPase subunit